MYFFLLFIITVLCTLVVFLLFYKKNEDKDTLRDWIKQTQSDIKSMEKTLHDVAFRSSQDLSEGLRMQTREISERLTKASEVIGDLKKEAGEFKEVSKSMQELQDFLKSPKLRGNLGEQVLNDLVQQLFPKQSFFIQYTFKTGDTVDIAIQTDAGILPIDSKFPLENFVSLMRSETNTEKQQAQRMFQRDLRKHIDAISQKYILPEEGTLDFALMYIPSESVYYEVVNDVSILEYARGKRVYPVSPTTLYANLQTILLSFQGRAVEQKTKELFSLIRALQKDYGKLATNLNVLGRHLDHARHTFVSVNALSESFGENLDRAVNLRETEKLE